MSPLARVLTVFKTRTNRFTDFITNILFEVQFSIFQCNTRLDVSTYSWKNTIKYSPSNIIHGQASKGPILLLWKLGIRIKHRTGHDSRKGRWTLFCTVDIWWSVHVFVSSSCKYVGKNTFIHNACVMNVAKMNQNEERMCVKNRAPVRYF